MRPRVAALTLSVGGTHAPDGGRLSDERRLCSPAIGEVRGHEAAPARSLAGAAVRAVPIVTPSAGRHIRTQLHLQFVGLVQSQQGV